MADNQVQQDEREAKLPAWARDLIAGLRQRVRIGNEPLVAEIARLRPRVELLAARCEAMTELLECAARGGHKDAQAIMEVIQNYDLTLMPKESK